VAVINVTETLVRIVFSEEMIQRRLLCQCIHCQEDILALTLNSLPCRYVSTNEGEAYVRAQYLDSQRQSDIVKELAVSISKINGHPRHPVSESIRSS
jgi:competence protein ComFB